jgi:hypothetical protein
VSRVPEVPYGNVAGDEQRTLNLNGGRPARARHLPALEGAEKDQNRSAFWDTVLGHRSGTPFGPPGGTQIAEYCRGVGPSGWLAASVLDEEDRCE